jgi:hypothetical protein
MVLMRCILVERQVGIIDKNICRVGIILQIKGMETFWCGLKFNDAFGRVDLKYTPAIEAIVCKAKKIAT